MRGLDGRRTHADAELMRIGAVHLKRERGLGIGQLRHAAARDDVEVGRIRRRHRVAQRRVRFGDDETIHRMRQRFREIAHRVCVPPLVAIGEVPGAGLFSVKQRRLVPDSVRFVGALVRSVVAVVVESAVVVELFGEGVDSADAERRDGRDGRESTCLNEKLPAICEGGTAAHHGWPLFSSDGFRWPESFCRVTREIRGNLLTVSERGRIRRRRRPWTGPTTQGLT